MPCAKGQNGFSKPPTSLFVYVSFRYWIRRRLFGLAVYPRGLLQASPYLSLLSQLQRCFALNIVTSALIFSPVLSEAQSTTSPLQGLTVIGQGPPSAYGAPEAFSGSRFGTLTQAYVLPAFTVYTGLEYEFTSPRQGFPDHLFTQELEIGLPYRFGIAMENNVDAFRGSVNESTTSFEMRYALADWNKIPLNPTLFAEYKIGIGPVNETAEVGSQEGIREDTRLMPTS